MLSGGVQMLEYFYPPPPRHPPTLSCNNTHMYLP
jgi:hypothetical protein